MAFSQEISGEVTHGNRIGRQLGFPTANIAIEDNCEVAGGVYAATAETGGATYRAMVNIGTRPTVGGGQRLAEAHLLDFNGDLYGHRITLHLMARIRPECKFPGLDELRMQLLADRENILNYFNNISDIHK